MVETDRRRRAIREVLELRPVASQAELMAELGGRGFQTTQPVLSRDLRAMGVAKRGGVYQLLAEDRVTPLGTLASLLRGSVRAGSNLVVVTCEPGSASAVARALEAELMSGVLGTVAGDDTVFVAVSGVGRGQHVRDTIRALLERT
jgi:transcriptional regulator of arginine metabolism